MSSYLNTWIYPESSKDLPVLIPGNVSYSSDLHSGQALGVPENHIPNYANLSNNPWNFEDSERYFNENKRNAYDFLNYSEVSRPVEKNNSNQFISGNYSNNPEAFRQDYGSEQYTTNLSDKLYNNGGYYHHGCYSNLNTSDQSTNIYNNFIQIPETTPQYKQPEPDSSSSHEPNPSNTVAQSNLSGTQVEPYNPGNFHSYYPENPSKTTYSNDFHSFVKNESLNNSIPNFSFQCEPEGHNPNFSQYFKLKPVTNKNLQLKKGLVKPKENPIEFPEAGKNFFKTEKSCTFCGFAEESLINSCIHLICSVCICNDFEKYLSNKKFLKKFGCKECFQPYLCKDFKEFVLEDSYTEYLRHQFVFTSHNPLKNRKNILEFSPVCDFCGENHSRFKISCLDHYKISIYQPCFSCKSKVKKEELNCECIYCSTCLKSIIKDQLLNNPDCKYLQCSCGTIIYEEIIRRVFGGKENYDRKRKKYSSNNQRLPCNICYCLIPMKKFHLLNCHHIYCKECLKNFFLSCIDSETISHIYFCPECFKPGSSPSKMDFDEQLLAQVLDKFQFSRYQKKMLRNIEHDLSEENLVLKWCKDCDYGEFINPIKKFKLFGIIFYSKPQKFTCKKCNAKYCSGCNKNHHGSSCPVESSLQLPKSFDMIGEYMKCPKCREAVERVSGCNFIHCLWPGCNNSYFCWICKKSLNDTQHFSHFKKNGPFGATCNTVDKIEEDEKS